MNSNSKIARVRICRNCSESAINSWKGWPTKDKVPNLRVLSENACPTNADHEITSANDIVWQNIHSSGNTGLPDYWELRLVPEPTWEGDPKWGNPYLRISSCVTCRDTQILSTMIFPDNTRQAFVQCGCSATPRAPSADPTSSTRSENLKKPKVDDVVTFIRKVLKNKMMPVLANPQPPQKRLDQVHQIAIDNVEELVRIAILCRTEPYEKPGTDVNEMYFFYAPLLVDKEVYLVELRIVGKRGENSKALQSMDCDLIDMEILCEYSP